MEAVTESGRRRVLSGSVLKVIATLAMFVDHAGILLVPLVSERLLFSIMGRDVTVYTAMRTVGRIAFPIFVFLLVEGFVHTHDRRSYGVRLGIFSIVSEVPWNLWHCGRVTMPQSQSVFVTLFLAYCGLCLVERVQSEDDTQGRARAATGLVALFVIMGLIRCDYGAKALGCALAMYLLRESEVLRAVAASSCLSTPLPALLAFVPIGLYNGERGFIRGRALQLLFYAIYPAHMLLLWYLKAHVIG